MLQMIHIAKALSDPNRLRALAALRKGELCVCQIIELLGLVASTVSKHMSILHNAGLVKGEKRGKWMYYSLDNYQKNPLLDYIFSQIDSAPEIKKDKRRLKHLSCQDAS